MVHQDMLRALPTALCLLLLHAHQASLTGIKSPLDLSYILNDLSVELGGLGPGSRSVSPPRSSGKPGDYVYPHGIHSPSRATDGGSQGSNKDKSLGTVQHSNNAGDNLFDFHQQQKQPGNAIFPSSSSFPGVQTGVYRNSAGDRVFSQSLNRPSSVGSSPGLQTVQYANNAGDSAHKQTQLGSYGINAAVPAVRYAPGPGSGSAIASGLSRAVSKPQPTEYVYPLYPDNSVAKRDTDLSSFGQNIGSAGHYPIELSPPSNAAQYGSDGHYPIDIPAKRSPVTQYANAGGLDKYPVQRRMILPSPYSSVNVPYAVNSINKNSDNDIYDNNGKTNKDYIDGHSSSGFPGALYPSSGGQKSDSFSDSLFSNFGGTNQPRGDPFSDSLFSNNGNQNSAKDNFAVQGGGSILDSSVGKSPINLGQSLFADAKPKAGVYNQGSATGHGVGGHSAVVEPQVPSYGHPVVVSQPGSNLGQGTGGHYGVASQPATVTGHDFGGHSAVVQPQVPSYGHPVVVSQPGSSLGQGTGGHYGVASQPATVTGHGQPAAVPHPVPAVVSGQQGAGPGGVDQYGATSQHSYQPVDVYTTRKDLQCWPQFFFEYTHDFSGSVWQDVKGHVQVHGGHAVFQGHGFLAIPFFACNDLLPRYSMIFVIRPDFTSNAPQAVIGNSVFSSKASILVSLSRNTLTLVVRPRAPNLTAQQLLDQCHSRSKRSVGTAGQYGSTAGQNGGTAGQYGGTAGQYGGTVGQYGGTVGTGGSGFQPQLPASGTAYGGSAHGDIVVLQLPIAGEVTVTIAQENDWISLSAGDQHVSKPGRLPTLTNEALYVGAGADPRGGDALAHYTGTFDSFLFEKCP